MKIQITNNSQEIIKIADLGIEIAPGSASDLSTYLYQDLISSTDLPTVLNNPNINISINDSTINYALMIEAITGLTKEKHSEILSFQHNIDQNYFMEVTKENGQSRYITYYSDAAKGLKIYEEEIIRDTNGKVNYIARRLFNNLGEVAMTEIQQLNRSISGKVESLKSSIE